MDMNFYFVIGAGVLALLYALWRSSWVAKQDPGNERMVEKRIAKVCGKK